MKTYDQRMEAILKKAKARKIARACLKTVTSALCIVAVVFGLMQIRYWQPNGDISFNGPSMIPTTTDPYNQTISNTEGPSGDTMPTNPTQPFEPDGKEHISVTIWMPDEGMAKFTQEQIERFNESNSWNVVIDVTMGWADEYVSADYIAQDPENAPDIYCFRQDDLIRLVNLNMLTPLGDSEAQWVKENNLPFTVDAVMYDGQVYAFPMSYQNVTLLYYDRSVISDGDVASLANILSACKAANRKFCFETLNPESMLTFFLATGCNSQWYPDADGNYTKVVDTLNSVEGRFALMGLLDILNSPMRTTVMRNGMSSNIIMEEVYRQCGAVITSDLYSGGMLQEILGENFGVTALPTFEQYDSEYQLHSLADSLMMGMKPQEDPQKAAALAELAKYLTGEGCQLERYQRIYWMIPSNLAALAQLSEDEPLIAAMVKQSQYAVPNMLPHGTDWWDIARDIVARFENDLTAEMTLELYAQRLEDLLDPPTGIWSVYDGLLDIDMVQQADGTWRTREPLYLSEKDGFIVRYEHSYDQACYQQSEHGYSYWKPGVAGYYHIFFDPVAWKCTWVNCEDAENMLVSGKAVKIWDISRDSDGEIQSTFSVNIPELNHAKIEYDMSESKIYVDGEYLIGGPGHGCVAFYLSDLTGDGRPELCFVMAFGSGIEDVNIVIIDYTTKNTVFSLSDRGFHDYYLFVKDGVLCVKETEYTKYDAVRTGVFAYNGTDISVVWDSEVSGTN